MAGAIPDVVIRLVADVDEFIRAWDRAADAAERAAARIRAAGVAAGDGPDASRFRDFNAELERLTRTAREAADSIRDMGNSSRRTGNDVDELGRRIQDLSTRLGSQSKVASLAESSLSPMAAVYAYLASLLPAVIAGALGLATAVGGVAIAAGVAALGSRGLGQAFDRLQNTIQPLRFALDSIFRTGLSQEFQKLGQTISGQLTPAFSQVAQAIVGVVKDTSEWIRSAEGISTIKTALSGVRDLVQALSPAVKGVVQIFAEWMAAAAPSMRAIGNAISDVVVSLRDMFREAEKSGQIKRIFDNAGEAIKGFGEIVKGIVMILLEVADKGGGPAADSMQKLGKALQDAAPAIGQAFKALAMLGDILTTVIGAISTAVGWFTKLAQGMNDIDTQSKGIKDFFAGIPDALGAAGDAIMKFFADIKEKFAVIDLNDFGPWADKMSANIKKGTTDATVTVGQWVTKTSSDLKQAVDKFLEPVKQWWDRTTQEVKSGIDKTNTAIQQGFDKANTIVKQTIDKIITTIKQWWDKSVADVKNGINRVISDVREFGQKLADGIQDAIDKAVQYFKDLGQKVIDALREMPEKLAQAGKDMVDGLIKGAESKAQDFINFFKNLAMQALAAAKSLLGIKSPSQVFADEIGAQIPAGIAAGIAAKQGLIQDALHKATARGNLSLAVRGTAAQLVGGSPGGGGGAQVLEVKMSVASGADGAAGTFINNLARTGKIKMTANAVKR